MLFQLETYTYMTKTLSVCLQVAGLTVLSNLAIENRPCSSTIATAAAPRKIGNDFYVIHCNSDYDKDSDEIMYAMK